MTMDRKQELLWWLGQVQQQQQAQAVKGFSDFVESAASLAESLTMFKRFGVLAALLYTDEDIDLAQYVHQHIFELNRMSGEETTVFLIEEPLENRQAVMNTGTVRSWLSKMRLVQGGDYSIAYSKAEAYDIASRLGVLPDQMPCLVFFLSLDQQDKICIPIPSAQHTAFFRTVFSDVKRAIEEGKRFYLSNQYIPDHVDSFQELRFECLRRQLVRQPDQQHYPTPSYNFYGTTVFVAGNVQTEGDFIGHDQVIQGDAIAGDKVAGNLKDQGGLTR
ncbi:MAG: hypothetical protein R2867_02475 [Caldilineaceae bacterium]